jgi:hypothetical protein
MPKNPPSLETIPDNPDFYQKIPSGYKIEINGFMMEPMIYQPTTAGLEVLAMHYNEKYGLDINIIDNAGKFEAGENLGDHFSEFKKYLDANKAAIEAKIDKGGQAGFVLCHGSYHVVPLMISRDDAGNKVMTIFDSSSGPRIKGYHSIANMFDDYNLMLNQGTRQSDTNSCMTDSIAILKDALRLKGLAQHIIEHKISDRAAEAEAERPVATKATPLKRDNFKVFLMPEELLKTAQVSEFVDEAKPDMKRMVTASEKSLETKRAQNTTQIKVNGKEVESFPINSYLHKKSRRFAEIINHQLEKMGAAAEAEVCGGAGSEAPRRTLQGGSAAVLSSKDVAKTH